MSKEAFDEVLYGAQQHMLHKRKLTRYQLATLLAGYMVAMETFSDNTAALKDVHENAKRHVGVGSADLTPDKA